MDLILYWPKTKNPYNKRIEYLRVGICENVHNKGYVDEITIEASERR